jgi:DNA-binding transcriptional ArsR family regulator
VVVAVFGALADPVRQRLVELLVSGEKTVGELASHFEVSRPAISRHLRVLSDAGIVTARSDAQRRLYRLEPGPLDQAGAWIERTRSNWAERLDALEQRLDDRWEDTP